MYNISYFLILEIYVFKCKNSEMLESEVHTLDDDLFYLKCKQSLHYALIFCMCQKF